MAKIKVRNQIEIERNVIERTLMKVRDFIKENKRTVLISTAGFFSVLVITISILVYLEYVEKDELVQFENIMNQYHQYSGDKTSENVTNTIENLKKLIDSTYCGFIHNISIYTVGNLYYSEKNYKEAIKYLYSYYDNNSSSLLAPIALLKTAFAAEEEGDPDKALSYYKILENEFSDSVLADQIYYNAGRMYLQKKDIISSKRNFNKVISSFPQSAYAAKASQRLILLNGRAE